MSAKIHLTDDLSDRQTGRQTGRANTEQVDQAGNAVILWPLHHEIGGGLVRAMDHGPHANRVRLQAVRIQLRPVGSDGGDKICLATLILVIDTNVLIAGVLTSNTQSPVFRIVDAMLEGRVLKWRKNDGTNRGIVL